LDARRLTKDNYEAGLNDNAVEERSRRTYLDSTEQVLEKDQRIMNQV
jgi:hypothetical protein